MAVGSRHQHVREAVAHLDRNGDLAEVEPPRLGEDQIVVDPAPDTGPVQLGPTLTDHLGEVPAPQHRQVGLAHPVAVEHLRRVLRHVGDHPGEFFLDVGHQAHLTLDRGAELGDIEGIHAGEPVQPFGRVGRTADVAAGPDDPIG